MPRLEVDDHFAGFRDTSQDSTQENVYWRSREHRPETDTTGVDSRENKVHKGTQEGQPAEVEESPPPQENAVDEDTAPGQESALEDENAWTEVRGLYDEGDRGEARLHAARLARAERTFATLRRSGELYVLDPERITYRPSGEQALRELLADRLGPYFSRREAREIATRIRAETYVDGFGPAKAIPLQNGDLSLQGGLSAGLFQLARSTADRRFRARSAARWAPGARCPTFDRFLRAAVPTDDDRQALQEYAGYCLMHWSRPYRNVLLLAGPEGSGRTLFLRALSEIVPWTASVAPGRDARGPQTRSTVQSRKGPAGTAYGRFPLVPRAKGRCGTDGTSA